MCHCDKSWTTRRWRHRGRAQQKSLGFRAFQLQDSTRSSSFFFWFSKADPPGSRPGVSASSRRAKNDGLGRQLGRQKEGTAKRLDSHRELATVDLSVFWNGIQMWHDGCVFLESLLTHQVESRKPRVHPHLSSIFLAYIILHPHFGKARPASPQKPSPHVVRFSWAPRFQDPLALPYALAIERFCSRGSGADLYHLKSEESRPGSARLKTLSHSYGLLVVDGYWWLLMVIDGYWWLLMVIDGYWWLLMVIDGYWWLLMVIDGYWWLLMVIDGYWWLLMVIDGYWWLYIDGYWWLYIDGYWWLLMMIDGYWWLLMVIDGYWWFLMVIDGYWELWSHMNQKPKYR